METIYFKDAPMHTYGFLPAVGETAPDFQLTGMDLSKISLESFPGKKIVLNIFPSLDTEVCAMSVRRFNKEAASLDSTAVLCISMDLPFAMSRFCAANGIEGVTMASAFRSPTFSQKYGVQIVDGPLNGLLARAVIIIDKDHKVVYRELVHQVTNEPDYAAALSVLKG
jgi:thiol peroxidase